MAFERNEPQDPVLALELPNPPPPPDPKAGRQSLTVAQQLKRLPGKLNYIITVDLASSIEQPAMEDFKFFLKNLIVE